MGLLLGVVLFYTSLLGSVHARPGPSFHETYTASNESYAAAPNGSYASVASTHCCGALEAVGFGSRVEYPGEELYEASIDSYWAVQAQLRPWCLIRPLDASEVSRIVTTLVASSGDYQCQFAVRSGGHTPLGGSANIEQGVTIDLAWINSTTYHPEDSTASIGVGARWGSVYETLDELGISSPGGRVSTVGVGGLVLGGGISFFNARKGFVCDSVVNFEVVLGSGEIVSANSDSNADLFQVLKGGSGNFGIVTRIDMAVFDNHKDLWGGTIIYPNFTTPQHAKAFTNFAEKLDDDPYASTILFQAYDAKVAPDVIVFDVHAYTKTEAWPPVYDEYAAIPGNFSDSTRITNMTDLTSGLGDGPGNRDIFITSTFQNDEDVLLKAMQFYANTIESLKPLNDTWSSSAQYMPIPHIYSEHSVEKGGNVLGLDRNSNTLVVILLVLSWKDAAHDVAFKEASQKFVDNVAQYSQDAGKGAEWRYINYAAKNQNPLGSYGPENVAKMRAAAEKYDPAGVFQTLVPGGFKISEVD